MSKHARRKQTDSLICPGYYNDVVHVPAMHMYGYFSLFHSSLSGLATRLLLWVLHACYFTCQEYGG